MTLVDRVPVERIGDRARTLQFHVLLLTLVAGLLFAAGWVAARAWKAVWAVIAWGAAAVAEGWVTARSEGDR